MSPSPAGPVHAVILAGGSGTRLWPISTRDRPKQFLSVGQGPSLIQQTWGRLVPWISGDHGWVVCGAGHVDRVREQLPRLPASQILAEPEARNTAAAIALAAIHLIERDPNAVMLVLPADHFIPESDWGIFRENLQTAVDLAGEAGVLVTLGIPPTEPSTGYGYIERGAALGHKGFRVRAFHEKPDLATAQRYCEENSFFWNSGMFVWKAAIFMEELERHRPRLFQAMTALGRNLPSKDFSKQAAEAFAGLENISVDYAVMEASERVAVIPASFRWDDVGSLTSLAGMTEADARGNHFQGEIFPKDASENLVISRDKPIALLGVKGLMVIEGEKAILIADQGRAQEVRDLVHFLKETGREDLL